MKANTKPPFSLRRGQRGYSTTEVGIGIAIAVIALAAAVKPVSQYLDDAKVTEASRDWSTISSSAKKVYADLSDFSTVTATLAINQKIFTGKYAATASTLVSPFGGAITVSAVNILGTNDGLQAAYAGLSDYQCMQFAAAVSKASDVVLIGTNTYKAYGTTPTAAVVALLGTTGYCSGGANTVKVQVAK